MRRFLIVAIMFVFLSETFTWDALLLRKLSISFNNFYTAGLLKRLSFLSEAYAETAQPYCLPTNDGSQTGVFSPVSGYCELPPLDPQGKCPAPYVYSTGYKTCVSQPLCPGMYVWDANAKQCVSVSAPPSGDTAPTFPDNSCAVDLNGNGEVEQNEIFPCTQTAQGYICSYGQTPCNPLYQQPTCPAGYTYNGATQKCEAPTTVGVCSSQQVPITQYQCPVTGQIYSDLNQCTSACLQTAQCSGAQVPIRTFWMTSPCPGRATQPVTVIYNPVDNSFYYKLYGMTQFAKYTGGCTPYSAPTYGTCWRNEGERVKICGIQFLSSSTPVTLCSYDTAWGLSSGCYRPGDCCATVQMQGFAVNVIGWDAYYGDRFNWWFTASNTGFPTTIFCPLGSQYPCSGNPPTCTKGQACVTNSTTVTKWQCSLNGVQYDTQDQCTTFCYTGCPAGGAFNPSTGKCEATATCSTGTLQPQGCFTGYGCPLGNYQCTQVNNQWMCSPYQCITQSQLQDEGDVIPFGYEDDGPRDEQGNCLGTIYIFNGKGMRCRKSGVQTGFHNCCNESRGKLYDSTGSTGGGLGAIWDLGKTISGIYQAVNVGAFTVKSLSANYAIVTFGANGAVEKVVHPVAGTLTGSSAQAWVDGMMQQGALTYGTPVSGGMTVYIDTQASADALSATTMNEFLKESGLAGSVVSLATSMLIKDSVLSSAVNVCAQAVLYALGYTGPWGVATAVAGLAMSLFMARCDQQDIMTSTLNDSKYCHEVGEYCIKKWPLVGCVQKAKSFCCFNSKLARIIHEQGRPQLETFQPNGAWTGWYNDPNYSVKNPNCRGFTPEEFQALDFNKIDLSEYIQDIERNIRQNLEPQLQQQVQQSWGQ